MKNMLTAKIGFRADAEDDEWESSGSYETCEKYREQMDRPGLKTKTFTNSSEKLTISFQVNQGAHSFM